MSKIIYLNNYTGSVYTPLNIYTASGDLGGNNAQKIKWYLDNLYNTFSVYVNLSQDERQSVIYQYNVQTQLGDYLHDYDAVNNYIKFCKQNNIWNNLLFSVAYNYGYSRQISESDYLIKIMYDISKNNYTITQSNNNYAPIVKNTGSYYDGNNYMQRNTFVFNNSASFNIWYKGSDNGTGMLFNHPCNSYTNYYALQWYNNNLYLNNNDSYGTAFKKTINGQNVTKTDLPNNIWNLYTLVITNIDNKALLYIDGNLYASASYKSPTSNNARIFSMGGVSSHYLNTGYIGQMSVYNITLSAGTIQGLYNLTKNYYGK